MRRNIHEFGRKNKPSYIYGWYQTVCQNEKRVGSINRNS